MVCRGAFKGHVPKGGDGSRLLPYRHKRFDTRISLVSADASRTEMVWCDGHLITGMLVDE